MTLFHCSKTSLSVLFEAQKTYKQLFLLNLVVVTTNDYLATVVNPYLADSIKTMTLQYLNTH